MKHLKKSITLSMLVTVIIVSRTFAQDYFSFNRLLDSCRAKEARQDSECTYIGYERETFFCNPLRLNERPLDYNMLSLESKGELTVIKGAAMTGQITQVPFSVYLRRNGNKVIIPGKERSDPNQIKIDLSEILPYAKAGDQLVIEPVKKEDRPVRRILKLLGDGC